MLANGMKQRQQWTLKQKPEYHVAISNNNERNNGKNTAIIPSSRTQEALKSLPKPGARAWFGAVSHDFNEVVGYGVATAILSFSYVLGWALGL